MPETMTAIPISEYEAVKTLLSLLREGGAERERQDIESLVRHMENMESQFDKVLNELESVQSQLKSLQDKGLRSSVTRLYEKASVKVTQAKTQFTAVKDSVLQSFADAVSAVKQKGVSALRKTVDFLKIRSALSLLSNKLNQAVQSLHSAAQQIQNAKAELHTAREHAANAARLFVGKKERNVSRLDSDRGLLSAIQRAMLKTGGLLAGMSKAANTAAGKLEQLEGKDGKKSVRDDLKTIRRGKNETRSPVEKASLDKAR